MRLEELVPSLQLCKELKENGYFPDTIFSYCRTVTQNNGETQKYPWYVMQTDTVYSMSERMQLIQEIIPAPTASEIGEQLPTTIDNKYNDKTMWQCMRNMRHSNGEYISCIWYANGRQEETQEICEKSEADARAKMWLYLKKNGLLQEQLTSK